MSPALILAACLATAAPSGPPLRLESPSILVEIQPASGAWSLLDKASGVRWPTEATAKPGAADGLGGEFSPGKVAPDMVQLTSLRGGSVTWALVEEGRGLEIRYEGKALGEIRVLDDALQVTRDEQGAVVVPCREGLLLSASSGKQFRHSFGTSDYEGCHMNMLGVLKRGSVLAVTWEDAYVGPEVQSIVSQGTQRIASSLVLRGSARSFRLTPLGKGDWNRLAAGYRRIAEQKGLVSSLREKIARNSHCELLVGAANVKLWTCLARRMNEESTKEESVKVRWTFDEAAQIAEHLKKDLGIERCLFMVGGWTEGGYDCRHPDNLPANPECGGNEALAAAMRRIQALGYVACLHDNYQDMYRDAKSYNLAMIEKKPDGSPIQGGRWLGGRPMMVCAPKQVELAMRPQNLPSIQKLFGPWSYFIDTTYAVGPRECADPAHRIGRNDDIAWKIQLSDKSRELFGLFGSECGREWALAHSDFFEGLVGVSGKYFHNLKPEDLGAEVIPFWEMVYHDCQICYGKYGYAADQAAQYVAHHVLSARPLHYHSIPDHLYWKDKFEPPHVQGDQATYARSDQGWAEGLHPTDAFLKTTHEVLGPLHASTALTRLRQFEFLTPDRSVRRAVYGDADAATVVVVNLGRGDATVESKYGGRVTLPPWGFVVDGPRFTAFCAKRWNGREYAQGTLFTLSAVNGTSLAASPKVRVFHGFGDPKIAWAGAVHEVRREAEIQKPL